MEGSTLEIVDTSENRQTADGGAAPPARPPAPRRALWWLGIGAVVVALAAAGLIVLIGGNGETADDVSTVGEFLEGSTAEESARIAYETADGSVALGNGGTVSLTDDLVVQVSVTPFPPTSFDVEVDLLLTTAGGEPVLDATIFTEWDMALMTHGPFETTFRHVGDGHYTAPFDLAMFGPWELITHISVPGFDSPDPLTLSVYVWPE